MITAQPAFATDQSCLRLVFSGPKDFKQEPIIVKDMSEAERMVYFYNRLYIKTTLIGWLENRRNVFAHVEDCRAVTAQQLIDAIDTNANTLHGLCRFVISRLKTIELLAPKEDSRYYRKYHDVVLEIIKFCYEREGVEQAC